MGKIITFDKSAKREILNQFDIAVDPGTNCLIEKDSGKTAVSPEGDSIELSRFAGMKKGSLIFVKSDINSIIKLYDSLK